MSLKNNYDSTIIYTHGNDYKLLSVRRSERLIIIIIILIVFYGLYIIVLKFKPLQ